MTDAQWNAYGDLTVRVGLNLKNGQCLLITTGAGTYRAAQAIAQAAYRHGARYVQVRIQDPYLTRYRIEDGNADYLEYLPAHIQNESFEFLAMDWARVRIEGNEDHEVLDGLDPSKVDLVQRTLRTTLRHQQESLMRDAHAWLVTAAPGPRWAEWIAKTTGEPLLGAYEKLEKAFLAVMRLDQADPIQAWRDHVARISRRSLMLNTMALDSLHFIGPGTDLKVGLCADSIWRGGTDGSTPDGRNFVANMPTEEIYTTPDYRRTEGRVAICRPVSVMDTQVRNAWFEFKSGKVHSFGADSGQDILERFLNSDSGARFLGELALVDIDSPIYQSGMVFGSILFDENASCHIALGAGYPSCLAAAQSLSSPEATIAAGCNVSMVHTDFMIGTEKTDVDGLGKDGRVYPIIRQGRFVI